MKSSTSRIFQILIAIAAIIVFIMVMNRNSSHTEVKVKPDGKYIKDFELKDYNGKKFAFSSLKDRYKLVYFGFTHCHDSCPRSLNKISDVMSELKKYNCGNMDFIFITTDPSRDKPDDLKEYLQTFDKNFIGLTGTESEIKEVANVFGAYYEKLNDKEKQDYMVNHTSLIYLIGKEGKYITSFHLDQTKKDIIDYIIKNKLD